MRLRTPWWRRHEGGIEWPRPERKQFMALTVGNPIAHYDVTALIGEGGMGQVYQATDTKLNRQVALASYPHAARPGSSGSAPGHIVGMIPRSY